MPTPAARRLRAVSLVSLIAGLIRNQLTSISTTHAITGSIVGVGATRRWSAVRWGVAGQIVWAWVLTIPAAFAVSAGTYALLRMAGVR